MRTHVLTFSLIAISAFVTLFWVIPYLSEQGRLRERRVAAVCSLAGEDAVFTSWKGGAACVTRSGQMFDFNALYDKLKVRGSEAKP